MGMLSANRTVSCSPPSSSACLFGTIIEFYGGINQSLGRKCLLFFYSNGIRLLSLHCVLEFFFWLVAGVIEKVKNAFKICP